MGGPSLDTPAHSRSRWRPTAGPSQPRRPAGLYLANAEDSISVDPQDVRGSKLEKVYQLGNSDELGAGL